MAKSTRALAGDHMSPDEEVDSLIHTLSSLEALTTLGGGDSVVQLTGKELYGIFHTLRIQAERIETALASG